ncbi:MatE family transporter [Bordetella sp. H567]|uniref:MatE family transporter n=1 Tax=Bordetella sp. H567 TaxID=1697043 RepID=UPI001F4636F7|nr:MatE family transporter [Bordetella sp. H567]
MATRYNPDADLMGNGLPGHGNRALGPSDSSDSASDLGPDTPDTDSDASGTGERADVEGDSDDIIGDDVAPDRIVDEDQAGLAHTRPDPTRNGG